MLRRVFFLLVLSVGFLVAADKASTIKMALGNKNFVINGAFIKYGTDSYDWLYVDETNKFIGKLEGVDESGYIKWKTISTQESPAFANFYFYGSQLLVDAVNPEADPQIQEFAKQFEKSIIEPDGFFIKYGGDVYDWIYITADRLWIAKLEGLNAESGNLEWLVLHDGTSAVTTGFAQIVLGNAKTLVLGDPRNLQGLDREECAKYGGTWYAQTQMCVMNSY